MKTGYTRVFAAILATTLMAAIPAASQTTYQPKFPGDPARSDSEAAALGYMRTALRAQQQYKKKYNKFAPSLADLVHSGSFTRRMTGTDRGDYTVGFHFKKVKDEDTFELTLTPKQQDAEHRSFYAKEDCVIHASEQGPADDNSPVIK